jgi:hypothetical protein
VGARRRGLKKPAGASTAGLGDPAEHRPKEPRASCFPGGGEHLLIFFRHHLVRELILHGPAATKDCWSPSAVTTTATSCSWTCRSIPKSTAPPGSWADPILPPGVAPGRRRGGSRVEGGRQPSSSDRTSDPLSREERRPDTQRGATQPPTNTTDVLTQRVTDVLSQTSPVLAGKPRAAGEMRHLLLRRPSACLGRLCDSTIVKCGPDFSAARSA